jgi:hypothetical protein
MESKKSTKLLTLSQTALKFANLESVEEWESTNQIFAEYEKIAGALWGKLQNDYVGLASLRDLREETRDWLDAIIDGGKRKREAVFGELVEDQIPRIHDSAMLRNGEWRPLLGFPQLELVRGRVRVQVAWLITGIHAVVIFGLMEIFTDGLVTKLARCRQCKNFYIETRKLRAACSEECYDELRRVVAKLGMQNLRRRKKKGQKWNL